MIGDHLSGLGFGGGRAGAVGLPPVIAGNPWVPGLACFWRLGEDPGSVRVDSISGFHALENGGVVGADATLLGGLGSETVDGTSITLYSATSPPLSGGCYCGAFWFKRVGTGGRQLLNVDGVTESRNRVWAIQNASGANAAMQHYCFGSATRSVATPAVSDNEWHMMYFGYDPMTSLIFVQIDAGVITYSALTLSLPTAFNAPVNIMGRVGTAGATFGGIVSHVMYWIGRVLNQAEVERLYNGGVGRDILVNP